MAPRKKQSTDCTTCLNLCERCKNCFKQNKSKKTPRRRPQSRRRSQRVRRPQKRRGSQKVRGSQRRRSRKPKHESTVPNQSLYSRNIYKVLKCIYPDLSITRMAMNVMNSFFMDLLDRIATEASTLVYLCKRKTMGYDDIISATKLVIKSPELCGLAIDAADAVVDRSKKR